MLNSETVSLLKDAGIFSSLTDAEISTLAPHCVYREFYEGEKVFEQGKRGVGLYIVVSGSFTVKVSLPGDAKKEIAQLQRESFFGEVTFISDQYATATITANEKSACLEISREKLVMFTLWDPQLAHKIQESIIRLTVHRIHQNEMLLNEKYQYVRRHTKSDEVSKIILNESESSEIDLNSLNREKIAFLDLPSTLDSKELDTYLSYAEALSYKQWSKINRTDQASPFFGSIYSGALQRHMLIEGEASRRVEILGPGVTFGYLSLLQRNYNFKTQTVLSVREQAILIVMFYDKLEKLKTEHETLWFKVISRIYYNVANYLYLINRQLVRLQCEFSDS